MFKLSISIKIACILLVGCIRSSVVEASNSGDSNRVELCISADPNMKATPSIGVPRPFFCPVGFHGLKLNAPMAKRSVQPLSTYLMDLRRGPTFLL
eukprot:scaffold15741_cov168-Skeletonema_marinoi.AAC.11